MKVVMLDTIHRFGELNQGELYRTENGHSIYMKIYGSSPNSVAIDSGYVFKHGDEFIVRPVEGAFVEEKQ